MSNEKDFEKIRKMLGKFGDTSNELHELFGSAYDDGQDDTQVTDDLLKQAFEASGGRIFNISGIYERLHQSTPQISCQENQRILRQQITGNWATFIEVHATTLHAEKCTDQTCRGLNGIAVLDKYYDPSILTKMANEEGLL